MNTIANYRGLFVKTQLPSCVVSLADLRRLYADLTAKATDALERHLAGAVKPADKTDDEWEELKAEVRKFGGVNVLVFGARGEQVASPSAWALADEQLPDRIASITFDSAGYLQNAQVTPLNRFRLNLDFTEPPALHAYNPWNEPTPNTSVLEVVGSDTTWVSGVNADVLG